MESKQRVVVEGGKVWELGSTARSPYEPNRPTHHNLSSTKHHHHQHHRHTSSTASKMPSSPASAHSDEDEHARKLCKFPGSRLIFANYDPGSDVHVSAFDRLSLQERANRSTRIAVEIPPNGACIWRFVPRANWEEGVRDEGIWPRQVNVCG
jgi:hypothetical protein